MKPYCVREIHKMLIANGGIDRRSRFRNLYAWFNG